MGVCVPIREMKNTAEFTRTVEEASGPVTVTRNGRGVIVSMTPERYEALVLEAARAELYQRIDLAEEEIAQGETVDAREAINALRARYGL